MPSQTCTLLKRFADAKPREADTAHEVIVEVKHGNALSCNSLRLVRNSAAPVRAGLGSSTNKLVCQLSVDEGNGCREGDNG